MHRDAEAQLRAYHADGQPQISGGADRDGVSGKQRAELLRREHGIVLPAAQIPVLARDVLRRFQHLVDAAARLDRPRNGQMAVLLEPQLPAQRRPLAASERLLHRREPYYVRLDDAPRGRGFRERDPQIRGKALQPRGGVLHVRHRKAAAPDGFIGRQLVRVPPCRLSQRADIADHRVGRDPLPRRFSRDPFLLLRHSLSLRLSPQPRSCKLWSTHFPPR